MVEKSYISLFRNAKTLTGHLFNFSFMSDTIIIIETCKYRFQMNFLDIENRIIQVLTDRFQIRNHAFHKTSSKIISKRASGEWTDQQMVSLKSDRCSK